MKKSQRLRLAFLQSKDKAALSAAEQTELATLNALAAGNPDSSKDIDDTKPLSAAGFYERLTAAFTAKQELASQLSVANASIADLTAKLEAATAAKPATDAALTAANTAKAEAESKLTSANVILGVLATALGLKVEELAGKDAAAIQGIFSARVAVSATEKLAELGFPSSGLPAAAAVDSGAGGTIEDLQQQLDTCADPQKAGTLVLKIRALRAKSSK